MYEKVDFEINAILNLRSCRIKIFAGPETKKAVDKQRPFHNIFVQISVEQ